MDIMNSEYPEARNHAPRTFLPHGMRRIALSRTLELDTDRVLASPAEAPPCEGVARPALAVCGDKIAALVSSSESKR